jgi:membrane associated rhomboid family serine protease
MIPIRDTIQSKNYPVMTMAIIAVNVAAWFMEPSQDWDMNRFMVLYGLVPARYTVDAVAEHFTLLQQTFSFLSFMFLHAGIFHLLGNMWFLYIFGDNVEDRLGPVRFLVFYLLCGWASGLSHFAFNMESQIPIVGASGAIAGVMGAYFVLYPRARVLTLIPLLFIPYFIEIPAAFFLGIWFLIQFLSASLEGSVGGGGIAWWAHVGGFLFGVLFYYLVRMIPATGVSARLQEATVRRRTPRLQVLRTSRETGGYDVYGTIMITPEEAREGTRKMVNIPAGFRKRLFRVMVPSGVSTGTMLKLAGLGEKKDAGARGDAYLRVIVDRE